MASRSGAVTEGGRRLLHRAHPLAASVQTMICTCVPAVPMFLVEAFCR